MENEITVLVTSDLNTLKRKLKKHNFKVIKKFQMNDSYMIDERINLSKLSTLEILSKCIIVREIPKETKELLYKIKNYAPNGDIISQDKISCPVDDLNKAKIFMEAINYRILFQVRAKCTVYCNGKSELLVQVVNDDYILIEQEDKSYYTKKKYKDINELKEDLNQYNLPIDKTNYFVKKAEIELRKVVNK